MLTRIQFLYYGLYRSEIDQNNRLSNWHQADELKIYLLTALFIKPGRMNWPESSRKWPSWDVNYLQAVLEVDDLWEMLRSFLISFHSIGGAIKEGVVIELNEIFKGPFELPIEREALLIRSVVDVAIAQGGFIGSNGEPEGLNKLELFVQNWVAKLSKRFREGGKTKEGLSALVKMNARLAEIMHLKGELKKALQIFEENAQFEWEYRRKTQEAFRNSALAGHGARRWVRAILNEVDHSIRFSKNVNFKKMASQLEAAKSLHRTSIRKLFSQTGIRTGLLLDEARIEYVASRLYRATGNQRDEERSLGSAERILEIVRSKQIFTGTNMNTKIDLESLFARVGLQMVEMTGNNQFKEKMIPKIKEAILNLRMLTNGERMQYQETYGKLMECKLRVIEGKIEQDESEQKIGELEGIRKEFNKVDIKFYDNEIEIVKNEVQGMLLSQKSARRPPYDT